MSDQKHADLHSHRKNHESNAEWDMRLNFLQIHQDKFPIRRLVCLSHCYINVELYGCGYPAPLMRQLKELGSDLPKDPSKPDISYRNKMQIKFVKASEGTGAQSVKPGTGAQSVKPRTGAQSVKPGTGAQSVKPIQFVRASHQLGVEPMETESSSMFDAPSTSVVVPKSNLKPQKKGMTFVKATQGTGSYSMFDAPSNVIPKCNLNPQKKGMTFVKSTQEFHSTDIAQHENQTIAMPGAQLSQTETSTFTHTGNHGNHRQQSGLKLQNSIQEFQSHKNQGQVGKELKKFYTLCRYLKDAAVLHKNAIEMIHMCADKAHMAIHPFIANGPGTNFTCEVKIDYITVAEGRATSKKSAKHEAYEKALEVLGKPNLRLVGLDTEEPRLEASAAPFNQDSACATPNLSSSMSKMSFQSAGLTKLGQATQSNIHAPGKQTVRGNIHPPKKIKFPAKRQKSVHNIFLEDLSQFLLVEPQQKNVSMAGLSIIRTSADINKVAFNEEYEDGGDHVRCVISVGGHVVAEVPGISRSELRPAAGEQALENLRQVCWTIQIKQNEDTDGDDPSRITRDNLLGDVKSELQSGKIGNSNIGNQLLKKMGWTGGGLGRQGTGIAEPISTGQVINREGLGLRAEQGISSKFLPTIKNVVMKYVSSEKETDLVFSPMFSKEERALIHKEAQKFGLKTHSHGTGEERYLIVSRKRTAGELFNHVMKSGGETSKYVLLPPGSIVSSTSDEVP